MRIVSFIVINILSINKLIAQEDAVQLIDFSTIQVDGIVLNNGWKFQAGDHAYLLVLLFSFRSLYALSTRIKEEGNTFLSVWRNTDFGNELCYFNFSRPR